MSYYTGNVLTTLSDTKYRVHAPTGSTAPTPWLELVDGEAWPATDERQDAVRVRAQLGYASAAVVPSAIKSAMLLLIAHWYMHRTEVVVGNGVTAVEVPSGASLLLGPYRLWEAL